MFCLQHVILNGDSVWITVHTSLMPWRLLTTTFSVCVSLEQVDRSVADGFLPLQLCGSWGFQWGSIAGSHHSYLEIKLRGRIILRGEETMDFFSSLLRSRYKNVLSESDCFLQSILLGLLDRHQSIWWLSHPSSSLTIFLFFLVRDMAYSLQCFFSPSLDLASGLRSFSEMSLRKSLLCLQRDFLR